MRALWSLIWLVVMALGSAGTIAIAECTAASVPFTFDYDEPTTAYGGPSTSVIGYDAAREHAADETRNATAGSRVLFAGFGEFFAAKGTAPQTFEIIEGVRRAKANQLLGNQSIPAQIFNAEGKLVGEQNIAIDALRSPNKSVIDMSTQAQK